MPTLAQKLDRKAVLAWAKGIYDNSVDKKDAAGFAAAFTADGWCRFANNPPIVGRDNIRAAIAQFFTAMKSLKHSPKGAFMDGDTLFLEAEVTYTRHDDAQVTVPAMTVFHIASEEEGGRFLADQCRIFVDLAPLFAP